MSRRLTPKQLVPFIAGRSLLQIAADRLEGIVPPQRRLICTGESHRELIRKALPAFSDEQILGEPVGRDTLNAIGFTAAVLSRSDPEAIFAVFTADHLIEPEGAFRECVDLAFRLVEQDAARLVTFSIKPTHPATGFGYVERADLIDIDNNQGRAFNVRRFVEKPDLETARAYLASGGFGWNSGMFVWRASTLLEAIRLFQPDAYEGLMRIGKAWGGPDQLQTLRDVYPALPKTSIDYAVMEPACNDERFHVCTVVADLQWRDVGSWPSYAQTLEPDKQGNRCVHCEDASVTHLRCDDTLIINNVEGHHISVLGVSGLVVIHTPDATLIMDAKHAQRLKELHALLPDELR